MFYVMFMIERIEYINLELYNLFMILPYKDY